MRTSWCLGLVVVGLATGLVWAAGPGGNGGGGGGSVTISPAEAQDLTFMREEEKLARDVYQVLGAQWSLPIFTNIAASEQQHMDAILTLLQRYNLPDPAAGNDAGVFTDQTLQALYDQLVVQGSTSLVEALNVGVLIEETDIDDLTDCLAIVVRPDIKRVYENLRKASYNHLAAFERVLDGLSPTTASAAPKAAAPVSAGPFGPQARQRHGNGACQAGQSACGMGPGAGPGNGTGPICPANAVRVVGAIASIDATAGTLVVGETTVATTANTVIKMNGQVVGIDALAIGQTVAACGVLEGDTLTANRITVKFCGQ